MVGGLSAVTYFHFYHHHHIFRDVTSTKIRGCTALKSHGKEAKLRVNLSSSSQKIVDAFAPLGFEMNLVESSNFEYFHIDMSAQATHFMMDQLETCTHR